jgi:hypothetical protein
MQECSLYRRRPGLVIFRGSVPAIEYCVPGTPEPLSPEPQQLSIVSPEPCPRNPVPGTPEPLSPEPQQLSIVSPEPQQLSIVSPEPCPRNPAIEYCVPGTIEYCVPGTCPRNPYFSSNTSGVGAAFCAVNA